ncbi:MAG: MFS transporter [Novosphingobium sp.]|nr:MFS transporter [Novosphingobium sp.]
MPNQSKADDRFVLLYALAWAGGTIAYVPLLTILLPVQVEALAGPLQRVDWLAYVALAGALAASAGGILFGYLSDVTRNRRGWIVGGLALSSGMLLLIGRAGSLFELILAIVCWQLALNMMLGPLAAWAGDVVPDRRKGLLGGLMAFAPGLGALAGAIVTQPGLAQAEIRLGLVAALVVVCLLPVLLLGPSVGNTVGGSASPAEPANYSTADKKGTMSRMWLARLAVQVAEATLFAFLYFWLLEVDPNMTDNQTARLLSAVMLVSAPLALAVGRWSDRTDRPIAPLQACALASALGLLAMALASDFVGAILAYGLFGLSSAVFLALHSAQTLRILPRPDRRGRDLGLFNLSNTVPSLVMPWLAIALVPLFGFPVLFVLLALLALASGFLLRSLAHLR